MRTVEFAQLLAGTASMKLWQATTGAITNCPGWRLNTGGVGTVVCTCTVCPGPTWNRTSPQLTTLPLAIVTCTLPAAVPRPELCSVTRTGMLPVPPMPVLNGSTAVIPTSGPTTCSA